MHGTEAESVLSPAAAENAPIRQLRVAITDPGDSAGGPVAIWFAVRMMVSPTSAAYKPLPWECVPPPRMNHPWARFPFSRGRGTASADGGLDRQGKHQTTRRGRLRPPLSLVPAVASGAARRHLRWS